MEYRCSWQLACSALTNISMSNLAKLATSLIFIRKQIKTSIIVCLSFIMDTKIYESWNSQFLMMSKLNFKKFLRDLKNLKDSLGGGVQRQK